MHRDLKPDNVMLLSTNGAQDFVKVLDFGISQASWRKRLTQDDGRISGTPQYMAPEQACGLREQIDHRSDQFSLAAIAYTLLTGREPFSGDDPIAVLYQVVHQQPPAPVKVVPALGAGVNDAIMRGLAKASDDRFPDVMEFAGALRAAVEATAARRRVAVETNELVASPVDVAPPVRARGDRRGPRSGRCGVARRGRDDGARRHRPDAVPARTGNEAAHSSHAAQEPRADANRCCSRSWRGWGRPPGSTRRPAGRPGPPGSRSPARRTV